MSLFTKDQILPLSRRTLAFIAVSFTLLCVALILFSEERVPESEESKACREAISSVLLSGTKVDQPLENQVLFSLTASQHKMKSIATLDWSDDEYREDQRPAMLMRSQGFRSVEFQVMMCWITLNTREVSECFVGMLRETDADIARFGSGPLVMETGYQPHCARLLEEPLTF